MLSTSVCDGTPREEPDLVEDESRALQVYDVAEPPHVYCFRAGTVVAPGLDTYPYRCVVDETVVDETVDIVDSLRIDNDDKVKDGVVGCWRASLGRGPSWHRGRRRRKSRPHTWREQ